MSTPFQRNFKALIARDGFSTRKLATALGMSTTAITKLKQGAIPRSATMKKIAELFNTDTFTLEHRDMFSPEAESLFAKSEVVELEGATKPVAPAEPGLIPVIAAGNLGTYRVSKDETLVLGRLAWPWPDKRSAVELFGIPVTEALAGADIRQTDTLFVYVGRPSEILQKAVAIIARNQQGKLLYGIPVDPAEYEDLYEPGAKLLLVRRLIRGDVTSVVVPYEEYIATAVGGVRLFH